MLNFVIKIFSCSSFYDLWTRQFHHTIVFVYELAVFFGSMLGLFGHSPLTWARRTSMFLFLILHIDVLFNLFMTHVLHLPCLLRPLYCPLDFLLSQCPFLVPWLYFRAVSLILEALYLLFPFLLTLQHLSVVVLCVSRLPAPVFVPPFPVASAGSMTSPAGSTSSTSAGDFYKAAASSLGAAYARPTTTASAEEKLSRRQVSFCTNCFLSVVCWAMCLHVFFFFFLW